MKAFSPRPAAKSVFWITKHWKNWPKAITRYNYLSSDYPSQRLNGVVNDIPCRAERRRISQINISDFIKIRSVPESNR